MVLDLKLAEDLALLESQNEFLERFKSAKSSKGQKILPMLASSCPGIMINILYRNRCLNINYFVRLDMLCRENSWEFYTAIHQSRKISTTNNGFIYKRLCFKIEK